MKEESVDDPKVVCVNDDGNDGEGGGGGGDSKKVVPVTLLSGFLGAGKTTLLRYILESHEHKQKVAVIVNDVAGLNVDAAVVGGDHGAIVESKEQVISLSNGCICCEKKLRSQLLEEVDRISKAGTHDYILIESTGVAEPKQVCDTFFSSSNPADSQPPKGDDEEEEAVSLLSHAKLDTCVTVLDAKEFPRLIQSTEQYKDVFSNDEDIVNGGWLKEIVQGTAEQRQKQDGGKLSIANLLIQQVEFANVILVNKTDLISDEHRQKVMDIVSTLNPQAKIIPSSYGKVDLKYILNSQLFSKSGSPSAGWLSSLKTGGSTGTEVKVSQYGIRSFVYKARKPFHPHRLATWIRRILYFSEDWQDNQNSNTNRRGQEDEESSKWNTMQTEFGQILRSKGFCWIADRGDCLQGSWAHSGRIVSITPMLPWCVSQPDESHWQMQTEKEMEEMKKNFEGPYGDRRQALVFIGIQLNKDAITSSLHQCLLTDDEMSQYTPTPTQQYRSYQYHDTLPPWLNVYQEPNADFSPILQQGQTHKFSVSHGLILRITNLALHCPVDVENHPSFERMIVKVYLDKKDKNNDKKYSRLITTLRPIQFEQYSLNVEISNPADHNKAGTCPKEQSQATTNDNTTTYWLRMETTLRFGNNKRKLSGEPVIPNNHTNNNHNMFDLHSVQVHVLGSLVMDLAQLAAGAEGEGCEDECCDEEHTNEDHDHNHDHVQEGEPEMIDDESMETN